MIKAEAYGLGMLKVAKELDTINVDFLGVAFTNEGKILRQNNISSPILVMNALRCFENIVKYKLTPVIFSLSQLENLDKYLKLNNITNLPVHIKVNTGMNRLGIDDKEINNLLNILTDNKNIKVEGICSHLSASEDKAEDTFTTNQIKSFEEISNRIEDKLNCKTIKHILNTSGIERFNNYQFDMVRLGLGLYGVSNFSKLKPVANFTATISQIKTITKGESVGYSRNFIAKKKMKIGLIPVGYADGYRRSLSNGKGTVYVCGKYVSTIGLVSMDMTIIDLTSINNVKIGDEVELFGENHTINDMAKEMNTNTYEVLTSISNRVERKYS
jgi:alanine racemase